MKVGMGVEDDSRRAALMRELIGWDSLLMMDANSVRACLRRVMLGRSIELHSDGPISMRMVCLTLTLLIVSLCQLLVSGQVWGVDEAIEVRGNDPILLLRKLSDQITTVCQDMLGTEMNQRN